MSIWALPKDEQIAKVARHMNLNPNHPLDRPITTIQYLIGNAEAKAKKFTDGDWDGLATHILHQEINRMMYR